MSVEPALTAEGWENREKNVRQLEGSSTLVSLRSQGEMKGDWSMPWGAHGLAALCLHGQPFGFTREDVELLRRIQRNDEYADYYLMAGEQAGDLADRIAALLPPEES